MKRLEPVAVAVITGLLAVGFGLLATPEYRFTGDTEHYVGLANAIGRGEGWSLSLWRNTQFPPGFPLILAPVSWLSHGSFAAIGIWSAVLACAVFPLTWLWARRRGEAFPLAIAVLTVFSYQYLDLATDNPMSEAVYMAVALGTLIWAEHRERQVAERPRLGWILLGCVLLSVLPAVRTIGMAAIAAGIVWLGLRTIGRPTRERRFEAREWIPVFVGSAFLLAWTLGVHHGRGGYFRDLLLQDPQHGNISPASLGQLAARPWHNLIPQLVHSAELLTGGYWIRATWYTPALLGAGLLLVGWWRNLRGGGRFAALYFAGYVAIVLMWPFEVGTRFLLPMLPLLWAFLFEGVRQVGKAIAERRSWVRVAGAVWAGAALAGLVLAYRNDPAAFRRQEQAGLILWGAALLALLLAWKPLSGIAGRIGTRQAGAVVAAGALLFALVSMYLVAPRVVPRARGTLPLWGSQKAIHQAARWIADSVPKDAAVLATQASRLAFATGRRMVYLPVTLDPQRIAEVDRRSHPQYLFINEDDDDWHVPNDVQKFPVVQQILGSRLTPVYHFDGGTIYRLR